MLTAVTTHQRNPGGKHFLGPGNVPHQPEQHAFHVARRREGKDQGSQRPAAGGQHHACEQEPVEIPAARPKTQAKHDGNRGQCSRQRGEIGQHQAPTQQHRKQRAYRRPAGHAENIRIGKRIAQQNLQQHAGQRQQAAAGKRRQYPRQAQLPDNLVRDIILAVAGREQSLGNSIGRECARCRIAAPQTRWRQRKTGKGPEAVWPLFPRSPQSSSRCVRLHAKFCVRFETGGRQPRTGGKAKMGNKELGSQAVMSNSGNYRRLMMGQPFLSAWALSVASGSTATGWVTFLSNGRSFRESL